MNDTITAASFSTGEQAALHSLADMFAEKGDRDQLRVLLTEGATLSELVQAYRTQKRLVSFLKASAGLVVVIGGAVAVMKGAGFWPK